MQTNGGTRDGNEVGSGDGARTGTGQRWKPVDEHRMGTGTGAGTETRAIAEMGTGTRMETGMGTRTGSGKAEEREEAHETAQEL